jgi:Transposase
VEGLPIAQLQQEDFMTIKQRREFTPEFKREAVGRLASSGRTIRQIAGDLDLGLSTLNRWKHELRDAEPVKKRRLPSSSRKQQTKENIPKYYGMQEVGGSIPPGSTIYPTILFLYVPKKIWLLEGNEFVTKTHQK